MIKEKAKQFVAIALGFALTFSMLPVSVVASESQSNELDAESFFYASSRLIAENWDDNFVDTIVFTVNDPNMMIDGVSVEIDADTEAMPVIVDDVVMLPLDILVELVDGDIYFDATQQTITVEADYQVIELEIGSTEVVVDGSPEYIKTAPILVDGIAMVDLYGFAEYLGFEAEWNPETQEVTLTKDFQTRRLIVKTYSSVNFSDLGATDVVSGPDNITVLQFATIHEAQKAYEQLSANEAVAWAEPDVVMLMITDVTATYECCTLYYYEYILDVSYNYEYSLEEVVVEYYGELSIANIVPRSWGVDRIGANRFAQFLIDSGRTYRQVVVAVLDTGVQANHPFLQSRVLSGGRCFITNTNNPYDVNGHGTHVAGTVVDSTPGLNNIQILPVKVLANNGSGSMLGIANGIRWSASRSDVLNLSLGGRGSSAAVTDAVLYAINVRGATVVVAAGNSATNAALFSPAHILQAITISATDNANRAATFTNWGSPPVDFGAPGVGINSSLPSGGFGSANGTSMAAPHVAAAVAMYILAFPDLTPAQIQARFRGYVAVPAGWNARYGTGILNMDLALRP